MKVATLLAICIDISMKMENNILKILLVDYAKSKLSKKQMFFLYIKLYSIDTNTKIYNIMNKWIRKNSKTIIKQMINC
tara:strand:+ start:439 stop:672 length:234 start_codon:yes stop_codon:yes gene_type:complete